MPRSLIISEMKLSCSLVFISVVCLIFSVVMSSFLSSSETKLWLNNNYDRKLMLSLFIVSATKSLLLLPVTIGFVTTGGPSVLSAFC